MKLLIHVVLPIMGAIALASCGGDQDAEKPLFEVTISNASGDTLRDFGFEVDLPRLDSFHLLTGSVPVSFQLEDRNNNAVADKLYAIMDLLPASRYTVSAWPGDPVKPVTRRVGVTSYLASEDDMVYTHQYTDQDKWLHDGIILENDCGGYRLLMHAPFAVDLIGKRKPDIVTDSEKSDLGTMTNWGGDILDEGNSLGLGSPALCLIDEIYDFASFDSREVSIVANGPLRAEVHSTIKGVSVRDQKLDVKVIWELEAGQPWVDVTLELLTKTDLTLQFAFGIPKHEDATTFTQGKVGTMHFAYTYGPQSAQGEFLGMAVMVSEIYEIDNFLANPDNSFYLASPVDKKVTYRVMYSWSGDPQAITDEVQFLNVVRAYAHQYAMQPSVEVAFDRSK